MTLETNGQFRSRQQIVDWLIAWIAKELAMPASEVDAGRSLLEYSLSSLTATILVGDLEDWLNLRLPPSLAWDYPSIDAMADYLVDKAAAVRAATTPTNPAPATVLATDPLRDSRQLLDGLHQLSDQDVDALLRQLASPEQSGA